MLKQLHLNQNKEIVRNAAISEYRYCNPVERFDQKNAKRIAMRVILIVYPDVISQFLFLITDMQILFFQNTNVRAKAIFDFSSYDDQISNTLKQNTRLIQELIKICINNILNDARDDFNAYFDKLSIILHDPENFNEFIKSIVTIALVSQSSK